MVSFKYFRHNVVIFIDKLCFTNFKIHYICILIIYVRCYLKLGQWQESLQGINEHSIPAVLQYYAAAKEHDTTWYKAWHSWAYMNFETVLFYKHQQQQLGEPAARTGMVSVSLQSCSLKLVIK